MEKMKELGKVFQSKPKQFCWAISILVAVVATWESRKLFLTSSVSIHEPRVLVASRELSAGELISITDMSLIPSTELPKMDNRKTFTDQELFLLQGKKLKNSISKGAPITADSIELMATKTENTNIPEGHRAYFLEAQGLEIVYPGAKVDLVLKPLQDRKDSLILVENTLVLSVKRQQDSSGVVVSLTPDEIEWVERNLRLGRIVLALRNPRERTTRGALKKDKQGGRKRVKVELITEGT